METTTQIAHLILTTFPNDTPVVWEIAHANRATVWYWWVVSVSRTPSSDRKLLKVNPTKRLVCKIYLCPLKFSSKDYYIIIIIVIVIAPQDITLET